LGILEKKEGKRPLVWQTLLYSNNVYIGILWEGQSWKMTKLSLFSDWAFSLIYFLPHPYFPVIY